MVNYRNLNLIKEELAVTKFDIINSFYDINEKLHVNKRMLFDIINYLLIINMRQKKFQIKKA